MEDIRSDRPSPDGLPSVFTVVDQGGKRPNRGGRLLELRTEDGPVYVRPSWWQRIRLQRAFRYFHVVPPQLLSRSNQRLIAKLLRTAVVTPDGAVASDAIFGVVQKVHAKPRGEAPRLAIVNPLPARTPPLRPPPAIQILPRPDREKATGNAPLLEPAFVVRDGGLWPWIVSGAAAAAFIPLIMASVYGISLVKSTPQVPEAREVATPVQPVAKDRTPQELHAAASGVVPAVLPRNPLPNPQTRKHQPTAAFPLPAKQDSAAVSTEAGARPERRFVSELPPGYFAHPTVARHLVGEVRLRALIGADGSVKQVTVLSGNPRLAQAAMRAVMRWHYSPYEVQGDPVAVETEVKMSFFGPDAVSIASVADRPSSQLK